MRDMKRVLALGTVAVILGGVGGNAQAGETLIGKWHGALQVTDQDGNALPDQFYTLWIRSTKPRSVAGKSVDDPPVPCVGRLTALGASGGWTRFVDHNYRGPSTYTNGDRFQVRIASDGRLEYQGRSTTGLHATGELKRKR